MRKFCIAAMALLALAVVPVSAQPPQPKPGPEHEHFKQFEGAWDATIHSKEGQSKGIMMYKVGLGGLWLLEHFKGEGGGVTFEGMGATTYDAAKKKYVSVWIDSMSSSPMVSEGTYNKDKKSMTMTGSMNGPDGKAMKLIMTTVVKDADNMVFTMNTPGPDGKEIEIMKITYKRKSK
jgi:hypothetical protein